jgi:hypothetical protein
MQSPQHMSVNPASDPHSDADSQTPQNPVEDLQGLLMRLQTIHMENLTVGLALSDEDLHFTQSQFCKNCQEVGLWLTGYTSDSNRIVFFELACIMEPDESLKWGKDAQDQKMADVYSIVIEIITKTSKPTPFHIQTIFFHIAKFIQQYPIIVQRSHNTTRRPSVNTTPHIQSYGTQTQHVPHQSHRYIPLIPWRANTHRQPPGVHRDQYGQVYQVGSTVASQESTSDLAGQVRPCRCDGTPGNCRCIGPCRCVHDA